MKGMNKSGLDSLGYRESYKIDLVNNKKEALLINVLSIVVLVIMALLIPLFFKTGLIQFKKEDYFLSVVFFILSMILYIPLHEIVHGITLKCFTDERIKFGWKFVYAYCGSKEAVVKPKEYFLVALSPLLVFSLIFIALMAINRELSLLWYIMEIMNVSGSLGDIYVTFRLWKDRDNDVLVSDSGTDMTIWSR